MPEVVLGYSISRQVELKPDDPVRAETHKAKANMSGSGRSGRSAIVYLI